MCQTRSCSPQWRLKTSARRRRRRWRRQEEQRQPRAAQHLAGRGEGYTGPELPVVLMTESHLLRLAIHCPARSCAQAAGAERPGVGGVRGGGLRWGRRDHRTRAGQLDGDSTYRHRQPNGSILRSGQGRERSMGGHARAGGVQAAHARGGSDRHGGRGTSRRPGAPRLRPSHAVSYHLI